jgi:hypothetical protein
MDISAKGYVIDLTGEELWTIGFALRDSMSYTDEENETGKISEEENE